MKKITIANKINIAIKEVSGDAFLPTLIFLHEGLGSIRQWKQFPQKLCEKTGCRGLIYDRQGYGASSPMTQTRTIHYLHHYALKELPAVLNAMDNVGDYILVGHSDGGSISLIWAAEQDNRLLGVITEAAHVFVEPSTRQGIQAMVSSYQTGELGGLKKYHGTKTDTVFESWADVWLSDWFNVWNVEYLLPSIVVPVLAIQGIQDQYGTEAQVNKIVNGVSGFGAKRMVDHCGHCPHLERENAVITMMGQFINTQLTERGFR